MRYTFIMEIPDNDPRPIEQICLAVFREDKPGYMVSAHKRDAVADVQSILANCGTQERLNNAVRRLQRDWW